MKWLLRRILPDDMWEFVRLDYEVYIDEIHYYYHPYWHINRYCDDWYCK